jgi:hypothetical protein
MGGTEGLVDGSLGGDGLNSQPFQFLPRVVADHCRKDCLAAGDGLDNRHELVFPERVTLVEGTVFFDGDLLEQFRFPSMKIVNQETLGMAEVLIDFGA